ncbi:hypothetical protein [Rhizobium sp. 57MFTsu3.2]|uniref:hypothetical protein n=1 Tax=Rhizobium sp. 57MFTsu3.2 TaxID=1048681 RepID=UPI00146EF052|nr:hypothetical protein [Rhizobium sp. 57MFTsu3.2]NMN71176.1 hypothetical protein [Rhizobium sp. 57MFTsu3.2]
MLSEELKMRVRMMAEKYRQRELDFLEMLGKIPNHVPVPRKPRIRVKAISQAWSRPTES